MRSAAWQAVRARYWRSKLPKFCFCCLALDVPLDLHHRTYKNLGNERLIDLVAVCRTCHDEIHALAASSRMNMWQATRVVANRKKGARRAKQPTQPRQTFGQERISRDR